MKIFIKFMKSFDFQNICLEQKYALGASHDQGRLEWKLESHTKRLTDGKRVLVVVVVMVSTDSMVSTTSPSLSDSPFHDP